MFFRILQSIWIYRLVLWALSVLFIWAGTVKLTDLVSFGVVIRDFGIVPEWSVMAIAIALPVLEILAAVGLVLNIRGSLTIITGLLALFILIVGYAILLGLDIDCGCFGPEDPEFRAYSSLHITLYRDMAMLSGVFFLYCWRYRKSDHGQIHM